MISAPPQPLRHTTDTAATDVVGGCRVMVLRAGGATAVIEASHAREVAPRARAIRLPGAPSIVSGIVNVRGALLPLVDIGVLLGHEPAAPTGWLVSLELDGRRCALALDALPRLCSSEGPPAPAPTSHATVRTAVVIDGVTLPLLDMDALANDILLS